MQSAKYDKEITDCVSQTIELFQDEVRREVAEQKEKQKSLKTSSLASNISGSLKSLSTSARSLAKTGSMRKLVSGSATNLKHKASKIGGSISNIAKTAKKGVLSNIKKDQYESNEDVSTGGYKYVIKDLDWEKRRQWGQTVRHILDEIAPIVHAEEKFLKRGFHITEEKFMRSTCDKLLSSVLHQLKNVMESTTENDPLNPLSMMVIYSERVLDSVDNNSYLIKVLGYCLVEAKRAFDTLIKNQISRIENFKLRKDKRYGTLPFVTEFEQFLDMSEEIWSVADNVRRTELDRAYTQLTSSVFEGITRSAQDTDYTPEAVICFQNFNDIHSMLSRLKIQGLQQFRKSAKEQRDHYLDVYVAEYMGKPLKTLSDFFDGVENLINSGVAEEDVKFQIEYSKHELKKRTKIYTGKEVKRGLQHLYDKVERHTEKHQHRLLQVVWTRMQDEFMRQYEQFHDLITNRCYAGCGIKLEFDQNDILNTFADIAQSH